ncbi:hypothetical protein TcBrA4_0116940 [Trypanosoma cruzi]|nr:hypothetical protein TcBrA4_0116940 [Trypanosoma cruzi]
MRLLSDSASTAWVWITTRRSRWRPPCLRTRRRMRLLERQREHPLGLDHDEAQPLEAALLEDEAPHAVVERQREHRLGLDHDEAQPLETALLEDEAPHAVVERQREHRLGLDHDEAQPLEAAIHSEREGEPFVMDEKRDRDLAARDRPGFTAREAALLEDEAPHAVVERQREHRLGLDHDEAQPLEAAIHNEREGEPFVMDEKRDRDLAARDRPGFTAREAALLEDEAPHAVVERQREHRLGLDHDEAQPLEAALLEDEAPHAVVERQREHRLGLDHDEAQPLETALLEDEAPHAVVERQREHRLGLDHDEAQPLEAAIHSEREGEPFVMDEKRDRDLAARDRPGFTAREAALLEDEAPHAVVERQREHRLGLDHDEAQPLETALLEDEAPHAVVERQREHRLGLDHDEAQPLEAALLEDEAPHAVVERQREHRLGLDHDEAQPLEAARKRRGKPLQPDGLFAFDDVEPDDREVSDYRARRQRQRQARQLHACIIPEGETGEIIDEDAQLSQKPLFASSVVKSDPYFQELGVLRDALVVEGREVNAPAIQCVEEQMRRRMQQLRSDERKAAKAEARREQWLLEQHPYLDGVALAGLPLSKLGLSEDEEFTRLAEEHTVLAASPEKNAEALAAKEQCLKARAAQLAAAVVSRRLRCASRCRT